MKIDFNPHAAAQAQSARGPQVQTTPPAPEGSDDGVTITLSQAAKQILETGDADYAGKSPAHMARQFIADGLAAPTAEGEEVPNFSGPFGQIVKTFAPGHNKEPEVTEEPGAVPEDGGETAPVDETAGSGETGETGTTEGGDTTVVEGSDGSGIGETDPTVVVAEPDITEVLDESAPTDGETSEPASGLAGSGDAVASTGDGAASDGGTVGDAGESVAVVDAGDMTDELLELLDENSEEVV
jgi:hypothetical protein